MFADGAENVLINSTLAHRVVRAIALSTLLPTGLHRDTWMSIIGKLRTFPSGEEYLRCHWDSNSIES